VDAKTGEKTGGGKESMKEKGGKKDRNGKRRETTRRDRE